MALLGYPVWSARAGCRYAVAPTFGLPCPTTIFTIGLLCVVEPPMPCSPLATPVRGCAVGSQAAFLLGLQPEFGLIAAGLLGIALLPPAGRSLRSRTS